MLYLVCLNAAALATPTEKAIILAVLTAALIGLLVTLVKLILEK